MFRAQREDRAAFGRRNATGQNRRERT